ncbi:histidine phosphatase family protein [Tessaracoccus sp. SD287]|uniref:histidine phosphatase family protein n=1 Tax=Tessaracoccus sp. SD287 TaxID=2782008 RepID=UPI001A972A02|nr:histidine phosphatase family protein [Tessaracoccus sp. SD287]MBO1030444.1 histidine phosphatase family protein [Tessaracoccus sp. SD287]
MILHLVRHGQSTWNAEGRLQGQTMDVPLTELGLAQARDAAVRLAGTTLTAILTSDQLRARQTAELLAEPHGLIPQATPLLREQALGELEGRLTSELMPQPVPAGLDMAEVAWGGGESLADVYQRLQRLLAELRTRFDRHGRVMLVSHGDTLRVLLALLEGRTHREIAWSPITNCAVITREYHC